MVLKKSKSENSTLFIETSREFVKVTNSNKLTTHEGGNVDTIVSLYTNRNDVEYTAKLVPNTEIAEQDYNLSVSTYVIPEDKREIVDILKLNAEIEEIVIRKDALRREINAIIGEIEGGLMHEQ